MRPRDIIFAVLALFFLFTGHSVQAQNDRKVTFTGGARSLMNNNALQVTDSVPDTLTVLKNNGGYALIDLGVNVRPNESTEINGMIRIRNEYGGFWGSGVTFDVRQLWLRGVIANAVRYQLGDLNLKQTEFTLFNHHADRFDSLPAIFQLQNDIVRYEKYYNPANTWRMQGANVDFGLTFSKGLKELNTAAFITRLIPTDFSNVQDRLMAGASISFLSTVDLSAGYHVNSVFDVKGTTPNTNLFKNTVQSVDLDYSHALASNKIVLHGEFGQSNYSYTEDTLSPEWSDYFIYCKGAFIVPKYGLTASLGYLNVGPEYRSIGSQSKDVNYTAQTLQFNRYTSDQVLRPVSLSDLYFNENIYLQTVSSKFMSGSIVYNNALPYGLATFNRVGMLAGVDVTRKSGFVVHADYYHLREIKGQGTLALRNFDVIKGRISVPLNHYLHLKHALQLQVGGQYQLTKRTSDYAVEDVDYASMQLSAGLSWEFLPNIELLGGYLMQNSDGNEFSVDRNAYSEVVYYNAVTYDLQQQVASAGIRYRWTPNVFLCGYYQQSSFDDRTNLQADFSTDQFGLLFNMNF